jgi:hypothetical protein
LSAAATINTGAASPWQIGRRAAGTSCEGIYTRGRILLVVIQVFILVIGFVVIFVIISQIVVFIAIIRHKANLTNSLKRQDGLADNRLTV